MMRIFWVFILIASISDAQIITTFAGNGINGNTGDGGLATFAAISTPSGGWFDLLGNYYFVSSNGGKVRKIDVAGVITTIAGTTSLNGSYAGDNGLAVDAGLNRPSAVAVDNLGNIYVADAYNNRIRRIDIHTGIIKTIAGNGGAGFVGDGGAATAANLYNPLDICFDKKGNLYIAEAPHFVVRKVDTSGVISTIAGVPGISGYSGDGQAATTALFTEIRGLCVDDTGNLYLADVGNSRVRKIDTFGKVSTVAGIGGSMIYSGDGGPATAASVSAERVTIDRLGRLFITSHLSNRVRFIDQQGKINTVAGAGVAGYNGDGGLADTSYLFYPWGITFDTCNNLYISDLQNFRIRKVNFNPQCWPVNVKEPRQDKSSIYPNPAKDELHIDGIQKEQEYIVYSIVGVVMQQGELKEGNNTIDVSRLPAGMYMVEVSVRQAQDDRAVRRVVKRIIKQ